MMNTAPTESSTRQAMPEESVPSLILDPHARIHVSTSERDKQARPLGSEASFEKCLTETNLPLDDPPFKGTSKLSGRDQIFCPTPGGIKDRTLSIPVHKAVAITRSNTSSHLNTVSLSDHALSDYSEYRQSDEATDRLLNILQSQTCYTTLTSQSSSEPCFDEINVGNNGEIELWSMNKPLAFYTDLESFPKEYRERVVQAFLAAVEVMNQKGNGDWPLFERVYRKSSAVFQLSHKEKTDYPGQSTVARAFFPGAQNPTIHVYARALKKDYLPYLAQTFLHELGHVLGLRHEFAPEKETTAPCVTLGPRNKSSVMNWFPDPRKYEMQESDIQQLKQLYCMEGSYENFPIVVKEPKLMGSGSEVRAGTENLAMMDHSEFFRSEIVVLAGVVAMSATVLALTTVIVLRFLD